MNTPSSPVSGAPSAYKGAVCYPNAESSIDIVRIWPGAANRQDADRLVELSGPDIEVGGPHGSAHGSQVLRDWLGRAGLTLETQRSFTRGNIVVLAQHGVWRSKETAEVADEAEVATLFRVGGGRVTRVVRYNSLSDALGEAGLGPSDELSRQ